MPEPKIARGKVFRGFFTSSLIDDTSSSPANANTICGQKFTVSQFQCGWILLHVNCVTDPCRFQTQAAATISIVNGRNVATAPTFCSHFPTRRPTIFIATATKKSANDPASRNDLFCAKGAYPIPPIEG